MEGNSDVDDAVEILQQMGLKEYEARCFVALTRLSEGTAKRISEVSDVPRTRVYDAIRVLESKGLVEVQHTNPKIFRSISVEEAVENLLDTFESRTTRLSEALRGLEPVSSDDETEVSHEVWALSGDRAISNRTYQLVDEAEDEVALVVSSESLEDGELVDHLRSALDRGVEVTLGTLDEVPQDVRESLSDADVFVSDLAWLGSSSQYPDDDTEISRLMLVDRETILVSSYRQTESGVSSQGHAVFGRGFNNGLVAIVRRIISTGVFDSDGEERN
ncbi:MAG: TrmB family transcriptional regulator [Halobacteriales archaeon]